MTIDPPHNKKGGKTPEEKQGNSTKKNNFILFICTKNLYYYNKEIVFERIFQMIKFKPLSSKIVLLFLSTTFLLFAADQRHRNDFAAAPLPPPLPSRSYQPVPMQTGILPSTINHQNPQPFIELCAQGDTAVISAKHGTQIGDLRRYAENSSGDIGARYMNSIMETRYRDCIKFYRQFLPAMLSDRISDEWLIYGMQQGFLKLSVPESNREMFSCSLGIATSILNNFGDELSLLPTEKNMISGVFFRNAGNYMLKSLVAENASLTPWEKADGYVSAMQLYSWSYYRLNISRPNDLSILTPIIEKLVKTSYLAKLYLEMLPHDDSMRPQYWLKIPEDIRNDPRQTTGVLLTI